MSGRCDNVPCDHQIARGGQPCTSVDPILVTGDIPTVSGTQDVIVPGLPTAGIQHIVFYCSTNNSDTPQTESALCTGYWTLRDAYETYSGRSYRSGQVAGVRLQGRQTSIGLQTSGLVAGTPFDESPTVRAVTSMIAGGFRLTWTITPGEGLNLGGRWWAIVFPIGEDTDGQVIFGLDTDAGPVIPNEANIGLLQDSTTGARLDILPHGLLVGSCLNPTTSSGSTAPFSVGFDDFREQAFCYDLNNFTDVTSYGGNGGVIGQYNNAGGSIGWRGRQFRRDGSFCVDGPIGPGSTDRIMAAFLRGYQFSVRRMTKSATLLSQPLPDFGFEPTIIVGISQLLGNSTGAQGRSRRNIAIRSATVEETFSVVQDGSPNPVQASNATRSSFFALDNFVAGVYTPGVTGTLDGVSQQPTITWSALSAETPELYLMAMGPRPVCPDEP